MVVGPQAANEVYEVATVLFVAGNALEAEMVPSSATEAED